MSKSPANSVQDAYGSLKDQLRDIFINAIDKTDCDADSYLDGRDKPEFDEAWVRADQAVGALKKPFAGIDALEASAEKLRFEVFIHCMRKFGDSDLAAALSDDASLVFEDMVMEVGNEWVAGMFASYKDGKLPAVPGYEDTA